VPSCAEKQFAMLVVQARTEQQGFGEFQMTLKELEWLRSLRQKKVGNLVG
jgi:hypothetical protein